MKVYTSLTLSPNGIGVRYLLEPEELAELQLAGLIGEVAEVIGMQDAADSLVGQLQKQFYTATGGWPQ